MIKSRRLRWVGSAARVGEVSYRVLVERPEGKRALGDLFVGGMILNGS
jgi:hypothetical protein